MTELEKLNANYKTLAEKADEKRALMLEGKATRHAWCMACNKAHNAFMAWWVESCIQHHINKTKG